MGVYGTIETCQDHSYAKGASISPWCPSAPSSKKFLTLFPSIAKVPPHIPRPDYADDPEGTPHSEVASRQSHTVEQQTPDKIDRIRKACQIAAGALAEAGKYAKPGVTCDYLDEIVHNYIVAHDAYPSTLNYKNFSKSCCTSLNEVICHGIPDMTVLKEGDILNVDVSAYYQGCHGDVNETWFIGEVDEKAKILVNTTYDALMQAIETGSYDTLQSIR
jgi:methionyl aminopeptidase